MKRMCRCYFSVGADVIGRFTVIGTFGQPLSDRFTISWCVIMTSTSETKPEIQH